MSGDRANEPADRAAAARAALTGHRFAEVRWEAATGSTNADLLAAARAGAADGQVLVADHQSAGRGRLGRAWEAPPGGSLLVSVLVRPTVGLDQVHLLTVALGLAAVEALGRWGVAAALKWPNDVVVPDTQVGDGPIDRKLGGILAESVVGGGRAEAVVVGMGLNVQWPADLPDELAQIAIAANHAPGARTPIDRVELLVDLLHGFERSLAEVEAGRVEGVRARYLHACRTIGREVRVDLPTGSVTGTAVDVTESGHLVVRRADGEDLEITAGDVIHLR